MEQTRPGRHEQLRAHLQPMAKDRQQKIITSPVTAADNNHHLDLTLSESQAILWSTPERSRARNVSGLDNALFARKEDACRSVQLRENFVHPPGSMRVCVPIVCRVHVRVSE